MKKLLKKQSHRFMWLNFFYNLFLYSCFSFNYLLQYFLWNILCSGCLPLFRGFWLMEGGIHMKKRIYVIKFLNRLCVILFLIAIMLLLIKLDICRQANVKLKILGRHSDTECSFFYYMKISLHVFILSNNKKNFKYFGLKIKKASAIKQMSNHVIQVDIQEY